MALRIGVRRILSIVSGLEVGGEMPQEASEFGEKSLVINLEKAIPEGLLVSLELDLSLPDGQRLCEVTAKVVSCLRSPEDAFLHRVTFHLNQYNQGVWLNLREVAAAEQGRVERLFKAMKGEGE